MVGWVEGKRRNRPVCRELQSRQHKQSLRKEMFAIKSLSAEKHRQERLTRKTHIKDR